MFSVVTRGFILLLGLRTIRGGITWIQPDDGFTKTVQDPQTECQDFLVTYETPGGLALYQLIDVTPGSTAAPFSLDTTTFAGQAVLRCVETQVTETLYQVTVRATDSGDTSDLTGTILFTNIAQPVTISAVSTLSVVRNRFELGGNITGEINYSFSVSDASAAVSIVAKPPDTDCPFTAESVPANSGQYRFGLSGSLVDKSSPYEFLITAAPSSGDTASATVTVTLLPSTPIDGSWGLWVQWSECTSNCGARSQIRTRACDSPAASFDGQKCLGAATELRAYPVFAPPYNTGSYRVNINEDIDSSASILTLSASDPDTRDDSRGPINWSIEFFTDKRDPSIPFVNLFRATDGALSTTTIIVVNVVDVNDLDPVFTAGQNLDVTILDTTLAGQEIFKVTATDGDFSSPNNEIAFSLSGIDNIHFTIDDSGSIKIASPSQLDYTTKSQYVLNVIATDKATSNARSATAASTITLETAPTFTTPPDGGVVITKSENIGPGTSLFTCVVADEDTTNLGTLQLIVNAVDPASGMSYFTMDGVTLKTSTSGTSSTFDLEAVNAESSFLLTLRVSDGKYNEDTNIRVNITDINDNSPTFTGLLTQTVDDTLGIGQDVTTVVATDADVSSQYNSVTYSINSNNGDDTYFTMNEATGVLTLAKKPLKTTYLLTVKAKDVNNREGTTTLTIAVSDTVNECSSTPCQNGGTCYNNINYYFCDCVNGWTGRICETNINDCDPNPCENSGECTDGVASFTCNCSAGWKGDNCTQVCKNNQHGRNCALTCRCNETRLVSGSDSQKCNITSGDCFCNDMWSGSNCQTDVDECDVNSSICSGAPNQACENSQGSYECVCAQGFTLNPTNVCVAITENTTVAVNAGELLVICTVTQTGLICPDLTTPSVFNSWLNIVREAELLRIPDVQDIKVFNLSCGSLVYDLYIIVNDTAAAKTSLTQNLNDISNGKPLVLNNVTTVTSALVVSGKQVSINSTEDPTVQICKVYTAYSPCGSDFECKIRDGSPICQEKEKDQNGLIIELAIGLPLGILAIVAVIVVLCYFRPKRLTEKAARSVQSKRRSCGSRRLQSSKRKRDESHDRFNSKHADNFPRRSELPYTPTIEYDNYAVDPAWGKQNWSRSHNDWVFYKPASRYNGSSYRQSKRY